MAKKYAGISINEEKISIVVSHKEESGIVVDYTTIIPYASFDNLQNDRETINKVKKSLKGQNISDFFVSLPDTRFVLMTKEVPKKLNDQQIEKIIENEVKDYAVFQGSSATFGFVKTGEKADKEVILWCAIKESVITNINNFLKKCNIRTKNITIPSIALAKYLFTFESSNERNCLLHIDRDSTAISFISNDRIISSYVQDIGYKELDEGNEAMRSAWIGSINSIISYIVRNNPSVTIHKIYVAEEHTNVDIVDILKSKMQYDISLLQIKEDVTFVREEDLIKKQNKQCIDIVTAFGLSLLGAIGIEDYLSLFLSTYLIKRQKSHSLSITALVLAFVVVNGIFVFSYSAVSGTLKQNAIQMYNINSTLSMIEKTAEDVTKLAEDLSNNQKILSQYKSIIDSVNSAPKLSLVVKEIYGKEVSGISITDISVTQEGIVDIKGSAGAMSNVFDFLKNLSSAKYIQSVVLTNVTESQNGYLFHMTATLSSEGAK